MAVSVFIQAKILGRALSIIMWVRSGIIETLFGDIHLLVERAIKTWISAQACKSISDLMPRLSVMVQ